MKWREAIQSLDQYEKSLRKLMAEAAAEGDYVSVLRIADLAKAIVALSAEGRSMPEGKTDSLNGAGTLHHGVTNSGRVAAGTRATEGRGGRRATGDNYPKFFRRGNELVKVGWSKKERKEYNHRAPRRAVDAAAAAIRRAGANGRMFNGDALLPLKDPADGSAVPGYQAYVALAWLTHLGAVEQHGVRGGYTLSSNKQIDGTITTAWPELGEWRG